MLQWGEDRIFHRSRLYFPSIEMVTEERELDTNSATGEVHDGDWNLYSFAGIPIDDCIRRFQQGCNMQSIIYF